MTLVVEEWQRREKRTISALPPGTRRYLILSFGTWDLARRNIKYFINSSLPTLRIFLDSIQRDNILRKVRVFVTTVPAVLEAAYEDPDNPGEHSCLRNNAALAAVNTLLAETISSYQNVHLVDWFEVSVSRSREANDGIHFVAYDKSRTKILPILNDVGKAMTMLLVDQLCLFEK